MRTVVGLFQDNNEARRTVDDLKRIGVRESDVSLLSNEGANGPISAHLDPSTGARDPDTITRALCRMGLSEHEAKRYVEGIQQGYTLETALVEDGRANDALAIMRAHSVGGARGGETLRQGERATKRGKEGEQILPVIVEELAVGKREVTGGGVRATRAPTGRSATPGRGTASRWRSSTHGTRRSAERSLRPSARPARARRRPRS